MLSDIIITIFAVYGISVLLTASDGPWGIFIRLRNKFPNSPLQCLKCTATWVSFWLFVVMLLGWSFWLIPFAIVGVVITIEDLTS